MIDKTKQKELIKELAEKQGKIILKEKNDNDKNTRSTTQGVQIKK